jgi:glycosyltransferase 2 family protein
VSWTFAQRRTTLTFVAKAAVSGLLVAIILGRVDISGVRESLAAASWARLAVALAFLMASPCLGGLRWWSALRGMGKHARPLELTAFFSAALVVGQVLPSVAGDGVRVWLASRGYGLRVAFQSVLIERVFMVLSLLALALATSPLLAALTGDRGPIWISGALLAIGLAGFVLLLAADRAPDPFAQLRVWQVFASAAEPARRLLESRWGALLAFAGVLGNLNFALVALLLGKALGVGATGWDFLAIMPAVTLATTLPISLGGWGVREGVFVFLLGRIGVPAAEALSLSFLYGVFGMVCGFPGLLAWAAIGWRARAELTRSAGAVSFPSARQ